MHMKFSVMMHKRLISFMTVLIVVLLNLSNSFAQIEPGIGINILPEDGDPICPIPTVSSNPNGGGPLVGEEVQDFNLFEIDGTPHRLSDELVSGIPVLLIAGSLICPVFRERIPVINAMAAAYQNLLKIFIVYTVEAHPIDQSPYSGTVWVTLQNQMSNILYPQPTTYGERKALVDTLTNLYQIDVPILLDGPCNNWWLNYGTGANNAFLITTEGSVFSKHDWFNQLQLNMSCDVDLLISFFSGLCINYSNNGTFEFELLVDSTAIGLTNDVLAVQGTIYNTSTTDFVVLDILKIETILPPNWEAALCADICYSPDADSIRIAVPPGSQQDFIYYFYTDEEFGQGYTMVLFRNVFVSNRHYQGFYGTTNNAASINSIEDNKMILFPNPATEYCSISNIEDYGDEVIYTILNTNGQVIVEGIVDGNIDTSELASGQYTILISGENKHGSETLVIH